MEIKLYKWSGAGNKFVVLDGRRADVDEYRKPSTISNLCQQYKTDGLMILGNSAEHDFAMEFYNPDGTGGMMCGNGGRCIVAFANYLGIGSSRYDFEAPDGIHSAEILEHKEERKWTVRLHMVDVDGIQEMLGGFFLNTGTRHFVKFVPCVEKVDVALEGRLLRWRQEFAPVGSNVNFVSIAEDGLHVRTFEKGVEGETLACGTGLTAAAIAAYYSGVSPYSVLKDGRVEYHLKARQDWVEVDFLPAGNNSFSQVYLTGPAEILQ